MLTIDSTVTTAYPSVKMGILVLKNVDSSVSLSQSIQSEVIAEIHQRYGHLDRSALKTTEPIQAYVSYYRKFGYSYHVLAQLESMLSGKRTPHGNSGLLMTMFLSELESMLLTAGHDFVKLQPPLQLRITTGGECYQSISGKETTTVHGDLAVCDANGVLSSILRGPDFGSRITASTTDVLFTIYAPSRIGKAYIINYLQTLSGRIHSFSPKAKTHELSVFSAE